MECRNLLNDFPSMDRTVFCRLTDVVQYTDKLLKLQKVYSDILLRRPYSLLPPEEDDEEEIRYLYDYLSGKIPRTEIALKEAQNSAKRLKELKKNLWHAKKNRVL